jgi:hypothetical protein
VGARGNRSRRAAGELLETREITEALQDSTGALLRNRRWCGLATVMSDVEGPPGQPDSVPPPRLLDRQGWSTLAAGALLLLISFTTNDGDDNLSRFRRLPAHDQVGVGLHIAALAALVGVDEVFSVGRAFSKRRSCSTGVPFTTSSSERSS